MEFVQLIWLSTRTSDTRPSRSLTLPSRVSRSVRSIPVPTLAIPSKIGGGRPRRSRSIFHARLAAMI